MQLKRLSCPSRSSSPNLAVFINDPLPLASHSICRGIPTSTCNPRTYRDYSEIHYDGTPRAFRKGETRRATTANIHREAHMTALAVLAFIAAALIFDYFHSRHALPKPAVQRVPVAPGAPRPLPTFVNGFHVPQNLLFHIGHTWALSESPNLVRG